jgi:hypothetical protein
LTEHVESPVLPVVSDNPGTNSATLKPAAAAAAKKSPPAVDPMLDEAERILEDYISLLSKNSVLMANH